MKWLLSSFLSLTLLCCAEASPILSWSIYTFNASLPAEYYESQLRTVRSFPGLSGFDTVTISSTTDKIYDNFTSGGINPLLAAALATQTKLIVEISRDLESTSLSFNSDLDTLINVINDPATGYQLADLIVGILVGANDVQLQGASSSSTNQTALAFINEYNTVLGSVRSRLQGTILKDIPIGHMETPEVWSNPATQPILSLLDFVGLYLYPTDYSTVQDINSGISFFNTSIAKVRGAIGDTPLWVQTGWPTSGGFTTWGKPLPLTPSASDANTYWHAIGCGQLFNITNTIWEFPNNSIEIKVDGSSNTAQPANTYNLVDSSGHPFFDFTCPTNSTSSQTSGTGLSTTAKLGIGLGVGLGGALILAAVIYLIWRSRRQKKPANEKSAYSAVGIDEYAEPGVAVDH